MRLSSLSQVKIKQSLNMHLEVYLIVALVSITQVVSLPSKENLFKSLRSALNDLEYDLRIMNGDPKKDTEKLAKQNDGFLVGNCPPGVPATLCSRNPCDRSRCPAYKDAICKANFCGGCKAEYYDKYGSKVDCLGKCPLGILAALCARNPCDVSSCPANKNAACRAIFCGGCKAEYYDKDGKVDCGSPDPSQAGSRYGLTFLGQGFGYTTITSAVVSGDTLDKCLSTCAKYKYGQKYKGVLYLEEQKKCLCTRRVGSAGFFYSFKKVAKNGNSLTIANEDVSTAGSKYGLKLVGRVFGYKNFFPAKPSMPKPYNYNPKTLEQCLSICSMLKRRNINHNFSGVVWFERKVDKCRCIFAATSHRDYYSFEKP